jgi:hypothetical protein
MNTGFCCGQQGASADIIDKGEDQSSSGDVDLHRLRKTTGNKSDRTLIVRHSRFRL